MSIETAAPHLAGIATKDRKWTKSRKTKSDYLAGKESKQRQRTMSIETAAPHLLLAFPVR